MSLSINAHPMLATNGAFCCDTAAVVDRHIHIGHTIMLQFTHLDIFCTSGELVDSEVEPHSKV